MISYLDKKRYSFPFRFIASLIIISFLWSSIIPSRAYGQAISILNLPQPGMMVTPTLTFTPPILKGIKIYPDNPLKFDFIIDTAKTGLEGEELKIESEKLIRYFLASLTTPEDELWVNLSPFEKDRIIPEKFGTTEMGRDLLAQDYLLKQLTASLMYPESELGQNFWSSVYKKAYEKFGTTDVPINTFNKVWILPDKAVVYENGDTAFVAESHLKVMLEEDYLALSNNFQNKEHGMDEVVDEEAKEISEVSSKVVKEVIIPEIEKEVNEGKNFALLRQIYNSLILATWFKRNLKEGFLGKVYLDQNKVAGVDVEDKSIKEKIYQQYLEAYKAGVYNYIKEDFDEYEQMMVPRKYFSGGVNFGKVMAKKLQITSNQHMVASKLVTWITSAALFFVATVGLNSDVHANPGEVRGILAVTQSQDLTPGFLGEAMDLGPTTEGDGAMTTSLDPAFSTDEAMGRILKRTRDRDPISILGAPETEKERVKLLPGGISVPVDFIQENPLTLYFGLNDWIRIELTGPGQSYIKVSRFSLNAAGQEIDVRENIDFLKMITVRYSFRAEGAWVTIRSNTQEGSSSIPLSFLEKAIKLLDDRVQKEKTAQQEELLAKSSFSSGDLQFPYNPENLRLLTKYYITQGRDGRETIHPQELKALITNLENLRETRDIDPVLEQYLSYLRLVLKAKDQLNVHILGFIPRDDIERTENSLARALTFFPKKIIQQHMYPIELSLSEVLPGALGEARSDIWNGQSTIKQGIPEIYYTLWHELIHNLSLGIDKSGQYNFPASLWKQIAKKAGFVGAYVNGKYTEMDNLPDEIGQLNRLVKEYGAWVYQHPFGKRKTYVTSEQFEKFKDTWNHQESQLEIYPNDDYWKVTPAETVAEIGAEYIFNSKATLEQGGRKGEVAKILSDTLFVVWNPDVNLQEGPLTLPQGKTYFTRYDFNFDRKQKFAGMLSQQEMIGILGKYYPLDYDIYHGLGSPDATMTTIPIEENLPVFQMDVFGPQATIIDGQYGLVRGQYEIKMSGTPQTIVQNFRNIFLAENVQARSIDVLKAWRAAVKFFGSRDNKFIAPGKQKVFMDIYLQFDKFIPLEEGIRKRLIQEIQNAIQNLSDQEIYNSLTGLQQRFEVSRVSDLREMRNEFVVNSDYYFRIDPGSKTVRINIFGLMSLNDWGLHRLQELLFKQEVNRIKLSSLLDKNSFPQIQTVFSILLNMQIIDDLNNDIAKWKFESKLLRDDRRSEKAGMYWALGQNRKNREFARLFKELERITSTKARIKRIYQFLKKNLLIPASFSPSEENIEQIEKIYKEVDGKLWNTPLVHRYSSGPYLYVTEEKSSDGSTRQVIVVHEPAPLNEREVPRGDSERGPTSQPTTYRLNDFRKEAPPATSDTPSGRVTANESKDRTIYVYKKQPINEQKYKEAIQKAYLQIQELLSTKSPENVAKATRLFLSDMWANLLILKAANAEHDAEESNVRAIARRLDLGFGRKISEILSLKGKDVKKSYKQGDIESLAKQLRNDLFLRQQNIFLAIDVLAKKSSVWGVDIYFLTSVSYDIDKIVTQDRIDILYLGKRIDNLNHEQEALGYMFIGDGFGVVAPEYHAFAISDILANILRLPFDSGDVHPVNFTIRSLVARSYQQYSGRESMTPEEEALILEDSFLSTEIHERQHVKNERSGVFNRLNWLERRIMQEVSAYISSIAEGPRPLVDVVKVVTLYLSYRQNGSLAFVYDFLRIYEKASERILLLFAKELRLSISQKDLRDDPLGKTEQILQKVAALKQEDLQPTAQRIHDKVLGKNIGEDNNRIPGGQAGSTRRSENAGSNNRRPSELLGGKNRSEPRRFSTKDIAALFSGQERETFVSSALRKIAIGVIAVGLALFAPHFTLDDILEQTQRAFLETEPIPGQIDQTAQPSARAGPSLRDSVPNSLHALQAGDYLSHLSYVYYGDGNRYMKIFDANPGKIIHPDMVYRGDSIVIPEAEVRYYQADDFIEGATLKDLALDFFGNETQWDRILYLNDLNPDNYQGEETVEEVFRGKVFQISRPGGSADVNPTGINGWGRDQAVRDALDGFSTSDNAMISFEEKEKIIGDLLNFLLDQIGFKEGDKVVDVGNLGLPDVAKAVLARGGMYLSFDPQSDGSLIKGLNLERSDHIQGIFEYGPQSSKNIADESQNFVFILTGALFDSSRGSTPEGILKEAIRVLKDQGKIVIATLGLVVDEQPSVEQAIEGVERELSGDVKFMTDRAFNKNLAEKFDGADYYYRGIHGVYTVQKSPDQNMKTLDATQPDGAMTRKGGIDFNPNNLDIQTKGRGMDVPMPDLKQLENTKIDGFVPVIFNIVPVTNLQLLLGLSDSDLPAADSNEEKKDDGTISFNPSPAMKEAEFELAEVN